MQSLSDSTVVAGRPGGCTVEVDLDKTPQADEVQIFTVGGGFSVKGTVEEVTKRLSSDEWAAFTLSESGGDVIIRSAQVVALRGGTSQKRGSIGFVSNP
jgi:ApbE superfamily uncharacterized protein (UPF0280 family)